MPVTDAQLKHIAWLARERRATLHGARNWDLGGIEAAIRKVQHLDLAEVTMAAMRAAADRTLALPAAIGNPSAHCWRERVADPQQRPSQPYDPDKFCADCGKPELVCRNNPHAEHEFKPASRHRRAAIDNTPAGWLRDLVGECGGITTSEETK